MIRADIYWDAVRAGSPIARLEFARQLPVSGRNPLLLKSKADRNVVAAATASSGRDFEMTFRMLE